MQPNIFAIWVIIIILIYKDENIYNEFRIGTPESILYPSYSQRLTISWTICLQALSMNTNTPPPIAILGLNRRLWA